MWIKTTRPSCRGVKLPGLPRVSFNSSHTANVSESVGDAYVDRLAWIIPNAPDTETETEELDNDD